jgi:hypothetical protein
MDFDPWGAIIDPYLNQSTHLVLHHFIIAASTSDNAESLLDKLTVDWMSVYKDPEPPQHEYIIVRTKDSADDKRRIFIFHRIVRKLDHDPEQPQAQGTTTNDNSTYPLLEGLANLFSPSRPGTALSSMEEGLTSTSASTSTLYPPVSFPDPQHSIGDVLSLSATKVSQVVSDSLDKDGNTRLKALDQILGEKFIFQPRYGKGRRGREIQPNSLTFFELIILAQTVHEIAPHYSTFDKNCYWFCNTVFDACKVIYGHRLEDDGNPHWHHSEILGRWNGLKVSETTKDELSVVVHNFKKAYRKVIGEVKIVF